MARDLEKYLAAESKLWLKLGLTPTSRRVRLASGGEVRVQELGEGEPVVFIHGVSVAGASWCHLAGGLSGVEGPSGVKCILIDRPGCGLSDPIVGGPLEDDASVEAYADQFLPDLLDALELERAAVAATSYGGFFAFRGAASGPERVSKLIEYSWLMGAPMQSVHLTYPGVSRFSLRFIKELCEVPAVDGCASHL